MPINLNNALLSLASSPCGLFARFDVDAAAQGFGALPQAPQGLSPLTRYRCGGGFRLLINPSNTPLSLASSPCGLFARFDVDAAAQGLGALPQTPQGLSPLTHYRYGGGF